MKNKQYCILNKQYTKEEYEVLVPKIIEHMNEMPYIDKKENVYKYGEFFPIELSPFGYNNTVASDYLFIEKNDAIQQGYPWFEVPYGNYNITKNFLNLPNSIINTGNEILQDIIECKKCKKAYKILEYELLFLKRENLPLPILCSECRQLCRLEDKLKISLYERPCMCNGTSDASGVYKNTVLHQHGNLPCDVNFKTGYSPDRPEIVYCEKCYQQEVI